MTEKYIQDSLATIVVAHRLSTLSRMDQILAFDQGKIIEEKSHLELLSKKGHQEGTLRSHVEHAG